MTDKTVIVGTGIAGVSAAAAMRAAGYEGAIELVGDEPELPYRRTTVSKEIVRGAKTPDEVRIKPADWYDKQGVTLRIGERVESIDDLDADQVLLATGGQARTFGELPAGVRTLRALADVDDVRAGIASGADLVVVGAGLIGSEIAASARELGCDVTLLETAPLPLARVLPPQLGQMYVDLHKAAGVELHTGVAVTGIEEAGGLTVVRGDDGRSWSAPLVVLAVGMVPDTTLAEKAGLELDPAGGIVVDELGRTSREGVFAAGDVASMPNTLVGDRHRPEHWQHAQNHGTAVGRAMAGAGEPFDEVPWAWSDQYGHMLQLTGWPSAEHDVEIRGSVDDHDFTAYFLQDGVLRGAVGIGRPREIRAARVWIAERARFEEVA